jgi:multidrug resistance efflux pump
LVELDPRDFSFRLAQAQAQLDELKAQVESERTGHETDLAALEQERKLLAIAEDGVRRAAQLTQATGRDPRPIWISPSRSGPAKHWRSATAR